MDIGYQYKKELKDKLMYNEELSDSNFEESEEEEEKTNVSPGPG